MEAGGSGLAGWRAGGLAGWRAGGLAVLCCGQHPHRMLAVSSARPRPQPSLSHTHSHHTHNHPPPPPPPPAPTHHPHRYPTVTTCRNIIRLAPPLVITEEQMMEATAIIKKVFLSLS